ncbi:MAG: DUF3293 domain-containing protein [Burkholderiaceae bacterium]|nr:DUF3293 domain-containing protein [Burkholderiaceae bacterium]
MFQESVIDAGLIQAFRETHYQVLDAEPFTLRVDEHSAALAAAPSAKLHADLGLELACRSLAHIEGIGQHPSNQWAGEGSYLAFGLTLDAAKTLSRDLKQNAIVWSDADAVPRLILLR